MGSEEVHYQVLQLIQRHPRMTQRELAQHLGVSLGKANYCLNALIEKGFVKAENFRRNDRKLAYLYLLTPSGLEEKARATVHFLRRKMGEYEALKSEIAHLQSLIDAEAGDVSAGTAHERH
jgi:EPS-associated MarR family transcriptional regulator